MYRLRAPCHALRLRPKGQQFSTSTALFAHRAIIYTTNGSPPSVLSAVSYPSLPAPLPKSLNVKYILSPINPADINVIEGVYPAKPALTNLTNDVERVFVGGNEGLAEVTGVGDGVSGFEVGEWVVMGKQQTGTWRSSANVSVEDVIKVPKGVSEVAAATITVMRYLVAQEDVLMNIWRRSIQQLRIICCPTS